MIKRELSLREKEILMVIRPTTFRDIVHVVRKEYVNNRRVRGQIHELGLELEKDKGVQTC